MLSITMTSYNKKYDIRIMTVANICIWVNMGGLFRVLDTYAFNAFIPVITQVTMNVDYFIACAVKGRIERN